MESRTLNSQMLRGDNFQNMSPLLERLGFVGVGGGCLPVEQGLGVEASQQVPQGHPHSAAWFQGFRKIAAKIGRASCRERV